MRAWHVAFENPPVATHSFSDRGNGLVATRGLAKGEIIFTEVPLAVASISDRPHCWHCIRALTKPEDELGALPFASQFWPQFDEAIKDGPLNFCSAHCSARAAAEYPALLTSEGADGPWVD